MMSLKAILVEDEERGMRALELKLQENCPEVEILAKCWSAQEAISTIRELRPNLIFLDVRLDQKTGFDVLLALQSIQFEVVFVSGYEQYAIQAFREGALDYILKPIAVPELKAAVQKAKEKVASLSNSNRIVVPISSGIKIILLKDILYCQAQDNFTRIFLKNSSKTVMTPRLLRDIGSRLPAKQFFRIHRKHIVNLGLISAFHRTAGGLVIMENGDELGVSQSRREDLLSRLAGPLDF